MIRLGLSGYAALTREQTAQGITLDEAIARNLKELGYG